MIDQLRVSALHPHDVTTFSRRRSCGSGYEISKEYIEFEANDFMTVALLFKQRQLLGLSL